MHYNLFKSFNLVFFAYACSSHMKICSANSSRLSCSISARLRCSAYQKRQPTDYRSFK